MNEPASDDPILKEVWDARKKVTDAARASGQSLAQYLQRAQEKNRERLVRRGPVRVAKSKSP